MTHVLIAVWLHICSTGQCVMMQEVATTPTLTACEQKRNVFKRIHENRVYKCYSLKKD